MNVYQDLLSGKTKLSLIGLGYVGLPIAVAFAKKVDVIGFDVNEQKINAYRKGMDPMGEVDEASMAETNVEFTNDEKRLRNARFHIVAVPTPVKADHTPDLSLVVSASELLGKNLTAGSIVVYESTVYPGVTEDICVPVLERESGLKCGVDFKIGYSPERINPSDPQHTLSNIMKVVSGMDEATLDEIAKIYELVVDAGTYKATTIKVAEAAKVIENSQRDINIAFMNELSIIFNKMGIETSEVLKAAETKWNFLKFTPGLVGGHCIGVDPYYLTHKAEQLGYHSQIILAGRRINDNMGKYVAENIVKALISQDINVKGAEVLLLGFAFKANCKDTRNTKVIDIVNELSEYGVKSHIVDPIASSDDAKKNYGIDISPIEAAKDVDAVVVCVDHDAFLHMDTDAFDALYRDKSKKILFDLKSMYKKDSFEKKGYRYWSL